MALTILRSISTPGAPVLTNGVGSLLAVLDFCLVTNMGWTKPFTGANKAAYKQPAGSNGLHMRVDDSVGSNAFVRGCETMTTVDDVTTTFPTIATFPLAGGPFLFKANSASPTEWVFASDGKIFHFLTQVDATVQTAWQWFAFGDIRSFKAGDQFATLNMMNTTTSATTSITAGVNKAASTTAVAGHHFARSFTQVGGSATAGKLDDAAGLATASFIGAGTTPFPCPVDGGLQMSPIWASENLIGRRGIIPGMWSHGHSATSFNTHDTLVGSGDVAGRNFEFFRLAGNTGSMFLETTDTWG